MRKHLLSVVLLPACLASHAWAADEPAARAAAPGFVLPEMGDKPAPSRFSAAQAGYVQSWLRQLAPECPVEVTVAVAEDFLEELRQRHPVQLDRLLSPDFPAATFAPMLLRHAGSKLTGAARASQREQIAERRLAAVLVLEGAPPANAARLLGQLRDTSAVQHRRLLEGRLEDEELTLLLKKIRQPAAEAPVAAPAKVRELTAGDIVSEFVRNNQAGAALQRLHAYTLEGRFTGPTGETQEMLMFRMRPDRFRLVLRTGGLTRYIIAADGDRFWQQLPGKMPQLASARDVGERRYLREFSDPLFTQDGFGFERLEDGAEEGRGFHRIAVRRPDGSRYVARIDKETFRQVGRENEDKSVSRYSDFRDVAGLMLAFHEETTDSNGREAVLVISRITPNPGLVAGFFQPRALQEPDLFAAEKSWTAARPAQPGLLP